MGESAKARAERYHDEGMALAEEGKEEEAAGLYRLALELDPARANTWYNLGLFHKYRREWAPSLECNQRAAALRADDEPTNWNIAIAATALRDWTTARATWAKLGVGLKGGAGPILDNFGRTPVRINPDDDGEVVWAQRLCPVRARILNIPYPSSGYARGDIVLHDGAPTGSRLDPEGRERDVFNVFGLFETSGQSTWDAQLVAATEADIQALEALCEAQGESLYVEDWTANVQTLCKACSEGKVHAAHDHDGGPAEWVTERRVGFSGSMEAVEAVLEAWVGEGREVLVLELALQRGG
jgi:tetratricopeptide (TPR) repeat protein